MSNSLNPSLVKDTSNKRPRVLIVEDEVIVAEDLRHTLLQIGYDVAAHAASGEQAIKLSVEAKPDLVLMDIVLGHGMDGIHAAHRIRQKSDVPVIFLTAHADESTLQRAKISEPYAYLIKPFEERSLRATVEMALSHHSTEQRLRRIESWLCPVFNTVGDAVLAADCDGKVTFMNSVAELLSGGNILDLIGAGYDEVLCFAREGDQAPVENPLTRVLRNDPVANLPDRTVLISKAGNSFRVEGTAVPLYDSSQNLFRAFIAFRDVTARREMEQEIHRLKVELSQTHLSALDQHRQDNHRLEFLLHAISHDIRSPLTVLRGYADLISAEFGSKIGLHGQEMVAALGKSVLRIEEMVQGYVGLARTGRPDLATAKSVDMNALVREVIAEIAWATGRRAVQFDCGELPPVSGDRILLRQVLVNLISNAVKYSKNRPAARVTVSGRREGEYSVYTVSDDGIGFDESETAMLFNPFRRLTSAANTPGLGLGLSLVKAIIDAHGGQISGSGKPGCGASFEFKLPANL